MGVLDYFKPVSTWTPQQVRELISDKNDGDYNLVDVRQPAEYEKGHLPGARLIPVGQLEEHLAELDPDKLTITYCAAGLRSRAAASVLEGAGFSRVFSMAGGINAWEGNVAAGFPDAGIARFSAASSAAELIALAWVLEDGTASFYEKMAESAAEPEAAALFRELVKAERGHKEMLAGLYRDVSGAAGEVDFPPLPGNEPPGKTMEGGMRLDSALAWADGRGVKDVLELSISQETGSYDLYQILQRRATDEESRNIFRSLVAEERRHLALLTKLFEKQL